MVARANGSGMCLSDTYILLRDAAHNSDTWVCVLETPENIMRKLK